MIFEAGGWPQESSALRRLIWLCLENESAENKGERLAVGVLKQHP